MTVLFVRHGESLANTLRLVSNRNLPHPLTDLGNQQAHELTFRLRERGISKIYSSPILRAVQTAEIVAAELGIEIEISDGLKEYDCGECEGKGDAATWVEIARVMNAWLRDQDFDGRSPGGENFHEVERRFVPFIDRVRGNHNDSETVLIISHGGILRAMLPVVAENLSFEFMQSAPMGNTALIDTVWTPTGLVCRDWNGTPI